MQRLGDDQIRKPWPLTRLSLARVTICMIGTLIWQILMLLSHA